MGPGGLRVFAPETLLDTNTVPGIRVAQGWAGGTVDIVQSSTGP